MGGVAIGSRRQPGRGFGFAWRAVLMGSFALIAISAPLFSAALRGNGTLELVLQDQATGKPAGGRLVILDDRERPKRLPNCVMEGDSAYVFHELVLKLPEGAYRFEIEAGLEYRPLSGTFEIKANEISRQIVGLERAVDLDAENWATVEQGLHAPEEETAVIVSALGIDVAGFRMQPLEKRRGRREFAAPAETSAAIFGWHSLEIGGARLALWDPSYRPFGAREDSNEADADAEAEDAEEAKPADAQGTPQWVAPRTVNELLDWKSADPRRRIVADSPLSESLPFWIGLELVDAVAVLGPYDGLNPETMPRRGYAVPPADRSDPLRRQDLALERYRELLDAGVMLAPLGMTRWEGDRAFGEQRSYTATRRDGVPIAPWDAINAGLTWVTNGPLPRFSSAGNPPGTRFEPSSGEPFELDIAFELSSRYKVERIELHREGGVVQSVTPGELRERQGRLAERFTRSGWLLMVVRAQDPRAPRLAVTAPFRVNFEGIPFHDPHVRSVWLERLEQLETSWKETQTIGADTNAFVRAKAFWEQPPDSGQ